MSKTIPLGFIPEPLTIPIDRILLSRKVPPETVTSRKFIQIRASIEEVDRGLDLGVADGEFGGDDGRKIRHGHVFQDS